MTWYRLPVFVWSTYATSLILVLATPVLAMTLLMLLAERVLHVGIFSPQLGGDPLLFQHMFWFYSHPAVYIMILPSMGVISEIVPVFAAQALFGYEFVVWCSIAIAAIGFLVWGHHMFVAGQALYASLAFSFLSYLVAVPSAIKVFNWTATLHKGWIRFDAPMLYAFGFIGLFTIGGLTGLFLAALAGRRARHRHLFRRRAFPLHHGRRRGDGLSSRAFIIGGRRSPAGCYPEYWARFAAILAFFGFNLTFFPQFILGYLGMPRRYQSYPPEFQIWHVLSSAGASILAVGYALPLFYLALVDPEGRARAGQSVARDRPRMDARARRRRRRISTATPTVIRPPYQYDAGEPCMQAGNV